MKINKANLLKQLDQLKAALASKDIIEHSNHFAFLGDKIAAYNDDIALSVPTEIDICGAVPATELIKLLNKLKTDEIEMEIEGGEMLLTSGKTKAGIKFDPECKLPLEELGQMKKWRTVPEDFLHAVKTCLFSASKDMSKPKLTCVHIHENKVESSDSFRLTIVTIKDPIAFEMLIPAANVQHLVRYEMEKYCQTDGWVHFKTKDNLIFSSRIYLEEYPDLSRFLELDDQIEIQFPKMLIESLERAEVFGKSTIDIDSEISVKIEDKQITVKGQNDIGWSEEQLKMAYSGDPIEFKIHPDQFRDILTRTRKVSIDGSHSKIFFESDGFSHLLALI